MDLSYIKIEKNIPIPPRPMPKRNTKGQWEDVISRMNHMDSFFIVCRDEEKRKKIGDSFRHGVKNYNRKYGTELGMTRRYTEEDGLKGIRLWLTNKGKKDD